MKPFKQLLLSAALLAAGNAAQAQVYQQGDLTVDLLISGSHDSMMCASTANALAVISVQNSSPTDSVFVVDEMGMYLIYAAGNTSGATTWNTTTMLPMNPYIPDNQLVGGMAYFTGPTVKIIFGDDTIYNVNSSYMLPVSNPCTYGDVSGKAYIDNDGNCMFSTGDVPLQNIMVNSSTDLNVMGNVSSTGMSAGTFTDGTYSMNIQESWMTGYGVSLPSLYQFIFPATTCNPTPYYFTAVPQTGVDFALQCSSDVDVEAAAVAPPDVRPMMPFFLSPFVNNTGCDAASGTLTVTLDPDVTYNAALSTNPPTMVMGNTLTWSYANLSNLSNGAYFNSFFSGLHLTPNSSVNIGDTLCFSVTATAPSNDINAANNSFSICLPVVNSFDPNMIEVSPRGEGPNGDIPASTPELTYTIHFQNTGTATAYNVRIIDTLDADVQPNTLKIMGSTASVMPEWVAPGVVAFNFYGIMLPDSNSNEPGSHGAVTFSVKPDAGLAIGTQIKGKADIYFDFNAPILTNTVVNTISALGVGNVATGASGIRLYPVPAGNELTVDASDIATLRQAAVHVYSMDGREVAAWQLDGGKATGNISKLAAGMYYIRAVSGSTTYVEQFVKR